MFHLAPISTRNQFGQFLQEKGLTQKAVEIGTHRGDFARILLDDWPGFLDCVDPWTIPKGYEWQATHLPNRGPTREDDYQEAKRVLAPHAHRCLLLRTTSLQEAVQRVPGSLGFVYIDGDHERPGIDNDLSAWWPKLRSGGILAVHDWLCPGEVNGGWAQYVQPAVNEFAAKVGVDVWMVAEEAGMPWSAFMVHP